MLNDIEQIQGTKIRFNHLDFGTLNKNSSQATVKGKHSSFEASVPLTGADHRMEDQFGSKKSSFRYRMDT